MASGGHVVAVTAVFLLLVLLIFLLISYNNKSNVVNSERFYDAVAPDDGSYIKNASVGSLAPIDPDSAAGLGGPFAPSDTQNEVYNPVGNVASGVQPGYGVGQVGSPTTACYPRDRLGPSDLLPKDAANSQWAQMNPAGQGDIGNQNFLPAGFHIGINTQGQTLKNANLQLRSEPPNPQTPVGPWNISTIEYDDRQGKSLEIGQGPL